MINLKGSILSASLCLGAIGCATAKIESNVRPNYEKKLDRLYVLLMTSDQSSKKFLEDLRPQLVGRFEQRSVQVQIHIFNNLGLDEKANIKSEIQKFNPTHYMSISQTSKTSTTSRGMTADSGGTFYLEVQEFGSDTTVWKANLTTTGVYTQAGFSASGSVGSPEKTADEIIDALQKDHLITYIRIN